MELSEFIRERIAEDEDLARAALTPGPFGAPTYYTETSAMRDDWGVSVFHVPPARVLVECAAKRRIVEEYESRDSDVDLMLGVHGSTLRQREWSGLRLAVLILAAVYADHPDYDPVWRIR